MKKSFFLIAALLTLAACSKVAPVEESSNAISFQVANYVQTKADDAKPGEFTNEDFGAYAWYSPAEGQREGDPMFANEKVAKSGSEWKTVNNTYYWPKTGTVDFISYSPYDAEGKQPTVKESSIAWTKYTVGEKDLMYADKALKQGANVKTYYYNGVPTLFRHALAKLSFRVKANFLEWTQDEIKDEQTGEVLVEKDTTRWEVSLKSAKLSGIYNTGDLNLTVAADGSWPLPEVGEAKAHVWANPSGAAKEVELMTAKDSLILTTKAQDLYTDKDGKAQSFFVLPQALAKDAQKITLVFHIKTTHIATTDKKEGVGQGTIVIDQDYSKTIDLREVSSLAAWQMNQNIVYTICIKPTATDPNNPHTDDPEDVVITFDPAQNGWEDVKDATIQI